MKNIACSYVKYDDQVWGSLPTESLVDVATGGKVRQRTLLQTCWDSEAIYVRFECEDDHTVADYLNRDDPLYDQDVVEIFLDEEGLGQRYIELEISPRNVIFDAIIQNHGEKIDVNKEWDAEGLETSVHTEGELRIYLIKLPFIHFKQTPEIGTQWRVNFYRIDDNREGQREFQAWSPTGAIDYHISSKFGTLIFEG
ncbi:carbohydrate-binding family 9-like protein [Cohnella abietis]|uniref:Carbohydrate-binding domain-containing protein n=1 Tax=Cohnella abietis TaxID=2507935 RepID=A0A3T1D0R5_9BACL|nr:carbohydrate-binding family 9-like protein [Cohnella abietis]BBI31595.1 hypothetical protein KCTCHS21_09940 [Cohnella abietis]